MYKYSLLILTIVTSFSLPLFAQEATTSDLMNAIERNDSKAVVSLIKNGVDPSKNPDFGYSPLEWAISMNKPEMVKLLLDHGVDPSKREGVGFSPIMLAIIENNSETVNLLMNHGVDPSKNLDSGYLPLKWAIALNKPEMVNLLISHGADPSKSPDGSPSPLEWAISMNRHEMAKLLMDHGVDPSKKTGDIFSPSPLKRAISKNNPEMVKLLQDNTPEKRKERFLSHYSGLLIGDKREVLRKAYKSSDIEILNLCSDKTLLLGFNDAYREVLKSSFRVPMMGSKSETVHEKVYVEKRFKSVGECQEKFHVLMEVKSNSDEVYFIPQDDENFALRRVGSANEKDSANNVKH